MSFLGSGITSTVLYTKLVEIFFTDHFITGEKVPSRVSDKPPTFRNQGSRETLPLDPKMNERL